MFTRLPCVKAGVVLHQLVNLADLAPTFLDWMGARPMDVDGRSLAPLLRGSAPAGWRQATPITHERMGSAPGVPSWRGVRTTRYAYWTFEGVGTELYDMARDVNQRRNIAGDNPCPSAGAGRAQRRARGLRGRRVPPPRGPGQRVAARPPEPSRRPWRPRPDRPKLARALAAPRPRIRQARPRRRPGGASMRIARIETIALRNPFGHGGAPAGWGGRAWSALDTLLVRVDTEDGLTGWGEAFAYSCLGSVKAAVDGMVAPIAVGRDAGDIAGLMRELQQALHLFGRYGITMFALSGLDIALWDFAGKAAGLPLCRLLGGAAGRQSRSTPACSATATRRGWPSAPRRAIAEGYRHVKLHETAEREVRAARETAGGEGFPLMPTRTVPGPPRRRDRWRPGWRPYDLHWLEEPIFPPDDAVALARLRRETGVPLASGENACTAVQFRDLLAAGAVDYVQPSVTKVGGVTEFVQAAALAAAANVPVMPHSPYFGPGFLATLHLLAAQPRPGLAERFHLDLEASLYGDAVDPVGGACRVPDGPGLGREPDPDVNQGLPGGGPEPPRGPQLARCRPVGAAEGG